VLRTVAVRNRLIRVMVGHLLLLSSASEKSKEEANERDVDFAWVRAVQSDRHCGGPDTMWGAGHGASRKSKIAGCPEPIP
jgi:hypothetical protein